MESLFLKQIHNTLKYWYIPLLVGIFFVIVSIIAFTSPQTSLLALALLFSLSFLFGGISEIIFSLANRKQLHNWGWSLVFGIITTLVGLLLFTNPNLSLEMLALYVGFVILFRSISSISFAIDVRRYGSKNWGSLLISGILGSIFSFILIWNPIFAGMSIVLLVSLSFLFSGIFSIILALQLRKLHRYGKKLSPELRKRYRQLEADIQREWEE